MKNRIVCFGEVIWDIHQQRSSAKGRKSASSDLFLRRIGGAPANVAVGLARLGAKVSLVGAVGKDVFGTDLVDRLRAEGIDTKGVARLDSRTGVAFVTHDAAGEPRFHFYRHQTADMVMGADDMAPLPKDTGYVLLGTSTLMTPNLEGATAKFVQNAHKSGAIVVVDLNVRAHLWPSERRMRSKIAELLPHAMIVKVSQGDLEAIGGIAALERHCPRATWVFTRAEKPAVAFGPHGQVTRPTKGRKVVDATGAGDAFIAGLLATLVKHGVHPERMAWLDPNLWSRALDAGHAMGAKAVGAYGATDGLVGLAAVKKLVQSPIRGD
jgi:fructokinase